MKTDVIERFKQERMINCIKGSRETDEECEDAVEDFESGSEEVTLPRISVRAKLCGKLWITKYQGKNWR